MNRQIRTGINFGVISGILTATGIIVGLVSADATLGLLMAGVLVVGFTDAFSDALSMYLSGVAENDAKNLWQSTILTFFTKLIVVATYLIPLLLLGKLSAMIVSIVWSVILLSALGYYLGTYEKTKVMHNLIKYLLILALTVVIAYNIGGIFKNFSL